MRILAIVSFYIKILIHRDYCDRITSYVKRVCPLTDDVATLVNFIETIDANGRSRGRQRCYEHVLHAIYDDFDPGWRASE